MDDAELDALMMELETESAKIAKEEETVPPPVAAEEPVEVTAETVTGDIERELEELENETQMKEPAHAESLAETSDAELEELIASAEVEVTPVAVAKKQEEAASSAELHVVEPVAEFIEDKATFASVQPEEETTARSFVAPQDKNGLSYYIDVDEYMRDTIVTEASLNRCMMEQSGLRAYYGTLAAKAEAQAGRIKARFEIIEATLYKKHREALAAAGEKATEKAIENAVKTDPIWFKAKNALIEAESISNINRTIVESIKDRRDMIIQMGADRRDEYKGVARVLAQQQEREALADRANTVRGEVKEHFAARS